MDKQAKEYRKKVLGYIKKELKSKEGNFLDVGCGNCSEDIFFLKWGLDVYGVDIYQHENAKKILGNKFRKGSILDIPFKDNYFDYVYAHDVLHHVDEEKQRFAKHVAAIEEMKRVCKKGGTIFILEANRYNPLFYPHMVLLKKHNHFIQSYFKKLCKMVFKNPSFVFFEAHVYPKKFTSLFKMYEKTIELTPLLRPFIAYNMMIYEK